MTIAWKHKPLAGSSPKPWEERRFGQCAFPLDSRAGVKSCCLPVKGESSYCVEHRKIMHQPSKANA